MRKGVCLVPLPAWGRMDLSLELPLLLGWGLGQAADWAGHWMGDCWEAGETGHRHPCTPTSLHHAEILSHSGSLGWTLRFVHVQMQMDGVGHVCSDCFLDGGDSSSLSLVSGTSACLVGMITGG